MRALLALTALLCLATPPAGAAPPLTQAEVSQLMTTVESASRGRDVPRLGATLAGDCRIELTTRIGGRERVTLMTRDEYIEMLTNGFAALKDLQEYDYVVDSQNITLERDGSAATVVSRVTETVVLGGQRQVTHSEETARVERREGAAKIVAVSALTSP